LTIALLHLLKLPKEIPENQNPKFSALKPKKPNMINDKCIQKNLNKNKRKLRNLPEFRLSTDLISGPELHPVYLGVGIRLSRESPPNHLVLMKLYSTKSM